MAEILTCYFYWIFSFDVKKVFTRLIRDLISVTQIFKTFAGIKSREIFKFMHSIHNLYFIPFGNLFHPQIHVSVVLKKYARLFEEVLAIVLQQCRRHD